MQISPIQQNQNYKKSINKPPNFKGTYIVQIPHKAFSNPNNIQECTKVVGKQICKFRSKFDNFMNIFKQNLFCYPEKFSYMFSKKGMESGNLSNSIQWLRTNTGLPIADVLKENYQNRCFCRHPLGSYHRWRCNPCNLFAVRLFRRRCIVLRGRGDNCRHFDFRFPLHFG